MGLDYLKIRPYMKLLVRRIIVTSFLVLLCGAVSWADEPPVITYAQSIIYLDKVPSQTVHIEWTFELNETSVPENIKGFMLFQEGHEICFFPGADTRKGDCAFYSYPGSYLFTLAVVSCGGALISPKSSNYEFFIPKGSTVQKTILQMKYTLK